MQQIEGNNADFIGKVRGQDGEKKDERLKWQTGGVGVTAGATKQ